MTTAERISLLEALIQALEELLKPTMYEQPDFIPDDKDAPEWAKWKAMDKNGWWYWYSDCPCSYVSEWKNTNPACPIDKITNTNRIDPEYWKRSLMEVKR